MVTQRGWTSDILLLGFLFIEVLSHVDQILIILFTIGEQMLCHVAQTLLINDE